MFEEVQGDQCGWNRRLRGGCKDTRLGQLTKGFTDSIRDLGLYPDMSKCGFTQCNVLTFSINFW